MTAIICIFGSIIILAAPFIFLWLNHVCRKDKRKWTLVYRIYAHPDEEPKP